MVDGAAHDLTDGVIPRLVHQAELIDRQVGGKEGLGTAGLARSRSSADTGTPPASRLRMFCASRAFASITAGGSL